MIDQQRGLNVVDYEGDSDTPCWEKLVMCKHKKK